MKKKILHYIGLCLFGLLLLNAWMYYQQPNIIFYPFKEVAENPGDWGMSYLDVAIKTEDGLELNGWYIPFSGSNRVLLFFHGNAGNISHRRASLEIFHELGLNVLIVDYRGYGKSEGAPSEAGLYKDAMAAWRYLTEDRKFKPEQVVIFGRSLGGAVAANLASKVDAAGLILESTFTSADDFSREVFPVVSRLVVLRFGLNTAERIREVHYTVLILHSPDDDVVPYRFGERLFELANEPKRFVKLRGDHNSGFYQSRPEYDRILAQWIRELPAER